MGTGLQKHPKVVRMASALKADRFRIVGGLHSAWCLFDEYTVDGVMDGYTPEVFDELVGFPGLAQAMIDVNWLDASTPGFLVLPEFDTHNGEPAKRRAMDADRKRRDRKLSAKNADKNGTRGEENRGESKTTPKPPSSKKPKAAAKPRAKSDGVARPIKAWLESLADDEAAIPADDPVFAYARDAGLTQYIKLAWHEFREYHLLRPEKKQLSWRQAFHNYVRQNYLKLWQPTSGGGYELTAKGVQANRAMQGVQVDE